MSARGVLRIIEGGRLGYWCPGCNELHVLTSGWTFDGNYEQPTFQPSVLVTSGHFTSRFQQGDGCWCTFNAEHPDDPSPYKCGRCHAWVRAGQIEFLGDSTHELAGQTVKMVPVPD